MKSEQKKSAPVSEAIRCLDELEHLVESSHSVPLSNLKMVDEDAFFIATQRMKASLPRIAVAAQSTTRSSSTLRRDDTLLLIVDVQERLMPAIYEAERVEKNCILLANAARQLGLLCVITEQYPEKLGSILNSIGEAAGFPSVIAKMRFSACTPRTLDVIEASGRQTVLLCGIEAHVCVQQTALDLLDAGYSVFAARDAISSRTPENCAVGWERMMRAGVLPTSAESAIFELLEEAGTPDFKALLPFLK